MVLSGTINEDANFGSISTEEISQIHVDFEKVKYINSAGIKKWILWIKELQAKKKNFEMFFANCPSTIVEQMNVVKSFLPKVAVVRSFFVPFFCEICSVSDVCLYRLNFEFQKKANSENYSLKHPQVLCSSCKTQMSEDFLEAKYFSFLNKK